MYRDLIAFLFGLAVVAQMATTPISAQVIHQYDDEQWVGVVKQIDSEQVTFTLPGEASPRVVSLMDVDRVVWPSGLPDRTPAAVELIHVDAEGDALRRYDRIRLRAGLHRITLLHTQENGDHQFQVATAGPGFTRRDMLPSMLFHAGDASALPAMTAVDEAGYRLPELPLDAEGVAEGVRYDYFEYDRQAEPGVNFNDVTVMTERDPVDSGVTDRIAVTLAEEREREHDFGQRFTGLFQAPEDGEYTFWITSSGDSKLNFGDPTQARPRPQPPSNDASEWTVRLRRGPELKGRLEAWNERQLNLATLLTDQRVVLEVPVVSVRELWSGALGHLAVDLARGDEPADADTVYVQVGEGREASVRQVAGVVQRIHDGALVLTHDGQDRRIQLDRVVGIVLGGAATEPATSTMHLELTLLGGAVLAGEAQAVERDHLRFRTAWGQDLQLPLDRVMEVRVRNGRLIGLSELTPLEIEQVPFFDRVLPYQRDQAVTGGPIRLGEQTYDAGLGVQARTVLHYNLAGQFERFTTMVGLQQPEGASGDIAFRVRGDGTVLHEQASLRGDQPPVRLDLDVTDVERLTLEVDFGKSRGVGEFAAWAEPRLQRRTAD